MSNYDDDAHQEYRSALQEQGYPEMDHDENIEQSIDEFLRDLESTPQGIQTVVDYLMQGYTLPDAVAYAGYGQNSQAMYQLLSHDTGQGVKDKLHGFKEAHAGAKQRADQRAQGATPSEY
jgi:hypothetical protein